MAEWFADGCLIAGFGLLIWGIYALVGMAWAAIVAGCLLMLLARALHRALGSDRQ
jgi:hypothetical protein